MPRLGLWHGLQGTDQGFSFFFQKRKKGHLPAVGDSDDVVDTPCIFFNRKSAPGNVGDHAASAQPGQKTAFNKA